VGGGGVGKGGPGTLAVQAAGAAAVVVVFAGGAVVVTEVAAAVIGVVAAGAGVVVDGGGGALGSLTGGGSKVEMSLGAVVWALAGARAEPPRHSTATAQATPVRLRRGREGACGALGTIIPSESPTSVRADHPSHVFSGDHGVTRRFCW
jgi:hypothetical protein